MAITTTPQIMGMGKADLQSPSQARYATKTLDKFRISVYTVIPTVASLLYLIWLYIASNSRVTQVILSSAEYAEGNNYVDWTSIQPSKRLQWVSCLGTFLCARLTVPMDYSRPLDTNATVHIAMVMLPGLNHTTPRTFSASPLLLNPGGPGASGARMVQSWGIRAREMVGQEQDVIGFDPRGIGYSLPRVDCFSSLTNKRSTQKGQIPGNIKRLVWEVSGLQSGIINSEGDSNLVQLDERNLAMAKLCEADSYIDGQNNILRHVNTMNVVKDMASILDAWGIWVSSESPADDASVSETKLSFWGFSYGTLLGSTFAALYPHRISRVVLDGILDADDYTKYVWGSNIQDIDNVLEYFFHQCSFVKSLCQLYHPDDTYLDIKIRFHKIMDRLKESSMVFVDPFTTMPMVMTHGRAKQYIFDAMHHPMDSFPKLAQALSGIENDNYTAIAEMIKLPFEPDSAALCKEQEPPLVILESARAVVCSDKHEPLTASPLNETLLGLQDIYKDLSNQSYFADVWMTNMIGCRHWNISATGPPLPFPATDPMPKTINTSFPLLFISNTADPVCPLRGGLNMALKFKNAGFIEQKSEGHVSTSVLSRCTVAKVRAYFKEGIVPPAPVLETGEWTQCERDESPWMPFNSEALTGNGTEAQEESAIFQGWKELRNEVMEWNSFRW